MRKRITRIAPVQAGKVSAVLYGLISLPFALIMALTIMASPARNNVSMVLIIAMPVLYVLFGFLFSALTAWLYNVAAKWTGGIEFVTEEMPDA